MYELECGFGSRLFNVFKFRLLMYRESADNLMGAAPNDLVEYVAICAMYGV
jgi:hypothetical protein